MKQMYQKWDKLLRLFFEQSEKQFTIRKIAKETKIPHASVQRYLKLLQKEGLITKENKANSTTYFKFRKAFFLIDKLFTSELIDYLEKIFAPSVIIVFGSVRKGEYDQESDIDLFIETTRDKKEVSLELFEKKLGYRIQLFIENDIKKLPPELLNNIINGIKLQGYLQLK